MNHTLSFEVNFDQKSLERESHTKLRLFDNIVVGNFDSVSRPDEEKFEINNELPLI